MLGAVAAVLGAAAAAALGAAAAAASLLRRDVAVLGVPVVVDLQGVRGNAGSHPEEEKLFLTIVAQMHML